MATVILVIDPKSANLKPTNTPELVLIAGTNFPVSGMAMDASATEHLYFQSALPLFGASNTTIACGILWYSRTGQTTGTVGWGAAVACITPTTDTGSVEAKAFATATTPTAATGNGSAKALNLTTVTIANIDSATALDQIELDVFSNAGTMTGDRIITAIYLSYSDT
jgi:hypothetical protein